MRRRRVIYKRKKIIAPRLASAESRDACSHGLPPEVKHGLQLRAAARGESLSWMLEQDLLKLYGFERPEYVPRKKRT